MGRHSRRGPAPKGDSADIAARREERRGARSEDGRGARSEDARGDGPGRADRRDSGDWGDGGDGGDGGGAARVPGGGPAGAARPADGTPARGVPRAADGTAARGVPRAADGAPARGASKLADGTPARGVSKAADGTPAHGVPGPAGDASARGARGGHPEQREAGGGWGELAGRRAGTGGTGVVLPRQRQAEPGAPGPGGARRRPGPRQEYLEAFDAGGSRGPGGSGDGPRDTGNAAAPAPGAGVPAQRGGTKGWAFTGIAAAAVTTVLAVVVAGQVTKGQDGTGARPAAGAAGEARLPGDVPGAPTPSAAPSAVTLPYDQKMGRTYPLDATLKGPGKFDAVPGSDKAPGTGQKYRYRVDVEEGLGLDGALFAEAVQRTLNDKRSWAHGGARTFERISSGKPDFVITLASPGTTATWCAKSGLDTTQDNVSCDSAATERVMINAYRWAQGSKTYGDRIHAYRQMLINHEVGHRLGHGHVSCQKDGELAPVMQQQTKFLDHDGIHCRPNPWPYPTS
ncbi:DUF3152 domain-containing protein [Streptomyces sp. NPDC047841]|uniref:DUF3152 domain-containing protein n=1 Tax=Streptomyces sp. NPDC047841 TaxID=3154708 RepID=UPI003451D44B